MGQSPKQNKAKQVHNNNHNKSITNKGHKTVLYHFLTQTNRTKSKHTLTLNTNHNNLRPL